MAGLIATYGVEAVQEALRTATDPQQVRAIRLRVERDLLGGDWHEWLLQMFPTYCTRGFARHHESFWRWVWSIDAGVKAGARINIWPRGGAKSTSAELATVVVGARRTRRYGLYVSGTQERADDHVQNVGSMLEAPTVERLYPALAARSVGKYGASKGWRRNRLRTASKFTLDAIGLDTAARGVKVDEDRPDWIILDDLDDVNDSPGTTARKVKSLTTSILPAGAGHVAILGVQNLIHVNSLFAQMADGRAEWLHNREVSGPIPAVEGLVTEPRGEEGGYEIVAGDATWEGQDLEACQALIDDLGLTAFLSECQHHVEVPPGGIFDHVVFRRCSRDEVPDLVETVVCVDPAVTDTDQSDSQAVQVDGIDGNGVLYRLDSWEQRSTPLAALRRAITWGYEYGARFVVVETDQGGDTWQSVYREALAGVHSEHPEWARRTPPRFGEEKAGAGHGPKTHRASQMLTDYERGRIVHVLGPHEVLEAALHRFPRTKPLDLVDASFWCWYRLRRWRKGRTSGSSVAETRLPSLTGGGARRLGA